MKHISFAWFIMFLLKVFHITSFEGFFVPSNVDQTGLSLSPGRRIYHILPMRFCDVLVILPTLEVDWQLIGSQCFIIPLHTMLGTGDPLRSH